MPTPAAATSRHLAVTVGFLLCAWSAGAAMAADSSAGGHQYRVVTVVEGLEHPWGMAFLPEGDILVTERPGRLRIVREGRLLPDPVSGVPEVLARGQGGLLDVALHPGFARNRLVYLSYARPGADGATTAITRGRLEGNALEDVEEIFVAQAWARVPVHFGSRLLFDRDGYLYLTIGDRGGMERAQDPGDHAGTTLRLHDDGSVPDDNPFVGRDGHLPEIWTYGNRNAQGMALHPETGRIWQNEHGPRGGDELNLMLPGRNYGWPEVTYGINYNGQIISEHTQKPGMEPPVVQWTPSIATSGLTIYTGDAFPHWRGDAFIGGLAGQQLARVRLVGNRGEITEPLLAGHGARIRDVRTGPDGLIYLLVDEPDGSMLRLEPAD